VFYKYVVIATVFDSVMERGLRKTMVHEDRDLFSAKENADYAEYPQRK